jgi:hypothetical protein
MGRTTRLVLSGPGYALLALVASALALAVFVLAQNLPLVGDVLVGGSLPLGTRLTVLVGLFLSFEPATTLLLLVVAALTGVDVALVTYHLREHRVSLGEGGGSLLGVVLGTLGAGCAACGSVLLAGVLAAVGAGGLLTLLPLEGLEFAVLALGALVLSVYWLADGMRGGEIRGCPVEF